MFIKKKKVQAMKEELATLNKKVEELKLQLEIVKGDKELLQCVHESTLEELNRYKEQLEHRKKGDRDRQRRYREKHKTK